MSKNCCRILDTTDLTHIYLSEKIYSTNDYCIFLWPKYEETQSLNLRLQKGGLVEQSRAQVLVTNPPPSIEYERSLLPIFTSTSYKLPSVPQLLFFLPVTVPPGNARAPSPIAVDASTAMCLHEARQGDERNKPLLVALDSEK